MTEMDWGTICTIVQSRIDARDPRLRQMDEVRQRYNGEWVLPWVSEEAQAEMPMLTPHLVSETIDNLGMRAASVMPEMHCPPVDGSRQTGVRSREYAAIRRGALYATHYEAHSNLVMRRFYRHLTGYATGALMVIPDFEEKIPRLVVRNPLSTYPQEREPDDFSPIDDCAFVYAKAGSWIRDRYPQARHIIPKGGNERIGELWDVIEWIDKGYCRIGLLGPHDVDGQFYWEQGHPGMSPQLELSNYPNRLGMVPVSIADRISLDKITSQVGQITGSVDLMARLQALVVVASEKAVFPDRYVIGDSQNTPRLLNKDGQWIDGRTGQTNLVGDAKSIGELRSTPDPTLQQMVDRLERNARVSTGLVPQMGGETYGALRTGRGIDALTSIAVDPRIQEMQEIAEPCIVRANKAIFECYKAYWGTKKFSMYSGRAATHLVEFTPNTHFEVNANASFYSIPGADVQGLTIQLGQLLGMGLISETTAANLHPWISDADGERTRREEELLERVAFDALAQQALQGLIPATYLAVLEEERRSSVDIFEALRKADDKLRKQQAQMAPPAAPEEFAPPEQMPGLAPPGVAPVPPMPPGAEPSPVIEGANGDQANFQELIRALGAQPPRGTTPVPSGV